MPLIIPNAGDTTGGNKYAALDQAEPDALDFEILSYGGSGVLTGCVTSSNTSSTTVAVSAGVVVLNGVPYTVSANATFGVPAAPTDNRFDIIVARVSSGIATLTAITGDDSSTNPAFPKSASVLTGAPSLSTNVNLDTDVVLSAVYRSGAAVITGSRILDKRKIVTTSIFDQGTSAPTSGYGAGTGSLFYKTGTPSGTASGQYVKTSSGDWIELAQNVGAHLPIGGVFGWPSVGAIPTGCVEANGQSLSKTTYAALFAVYGYTHGGAGDLFNVPDFNNKFLRGTTDTNLMGTSVGADTVTLGASNLPPHSHSTPAHQHSITHTHSGGTTAAESAGHSHSVSGSTSSLGTHTHDTFGIGGMSYLFRMSSYYPDDATFFKVQSGPDVQLHSNAVTGNGGAHDHTFSATTGPVSNGHTHTFTAPTFTGTTDTSGSGTSGDGSGTSAPLSVIPASAYIRWVIRATLGTDGTFTGGTGVPESFMRQVGDETTTLTTGTKLTFRVPYAFRLTNIRASLTTASSSGVVTVNVLENGVSLFATKITIDANEKTSVTAAAAAVLSDLNLADDAELTVAIDTAGTGAAGLKLTFYGSKV